MKRQYILWLIITLQISGLKAQNGEIEYTYIKRTDIDYKSFELLGDTLFALNDSGDLVIWNLELLDTIQYKRNKQTKFSSICRDYDSNIYLGTNKGQIYKIDKSTLSLVLFKKIRFSIIDFCFTSDNKLFGIVPYAVYDPVSNKNWKKFKDYNDGLIHRTKRFDLYWVETEEYFVIPEYTYLDSKDRWWMFKNYGEWGSKIQIFDAKNEEIYMHVFDSLQKWSLTPKSIFEDSKGNVFISSGIQHIGMSGEIIKIDSNNQASIIFDKLDIKIPIDSTLIVEIDSLGIVNVIAKQAPLIDNSLFIGPATYNFQDDMIYFSTNKGIYNGKINDRGKLVEVCLVFQPLLKWEPASLAVGYGMPIVEMAFTKRNYLLFQTTNSGFGLYKNGEIIMFK